MLQEVFWTTLAFVVATSVVIWMLGMIEGKF